MRWLCAALVLLLVACSDDNGNSSDSAGEDQVKTFAQEVTTAAITGNWAAVYDRLHPDQQAVVSRDLFTACRAQLTYPLYVASASQVGHDAMSAPQIMDRSAWVVTLNMALDGYETITDALHVYSEGGLSWYMDDTSIQSF